MNTKLFVTCALISSVGLHAEAPTASAQELQTKTVDASKILFVDMQQAMLECKEGADAQKTVEAEEQKYGRMAQQEQQRMAQLKQELDQKASMMSADARRRKEKELADLQRDYQNKMQDWQYELKYTMQNATDEMVKNIEQAAKTLGEAARVDVVKDKSTGRVLWLREDKNATNMLVTELDKQYTVKVAQKQKHDKKEATA